MPTLTRAWSFFLVLFICFPMLLVGIPESGSAGEEDDGERSEGEDETPVQTPAPPPAPKLIEKLKDSTLQAEYDAALQQLKSGSFDAAKKALAKLQPKAVDPEDRAAVDAATLEANGRVALQDVEIQITKGRVRQALAQLEKLVREYAGTAVGIDIAQRRDDMQAEIFFVVDDFEPKPEAKDAGGSERGGMTRYGLNTKLVEGSEGSEEVRRGKQALRWKTGSGLSWINFDNVRELVQDYRYLHISLRSEDPKKRPQLIVLFDCLDGFGGMAGRGGLSYQRDGFQTSVLPEGKWQDLRFDLKKDLRPRGDVEWDDVVALRLVHMAGVDATIFIDEIRLEKE